MEHRQGVSLTFEEKSEIVAKAYWATANHITRHKIRQNTIDGLKIVAFITCYTAEYVFEKNSHGATYDPTKLVCRAGVDRLSQLLKIETGSKMIVPDLYRQYLVSMLYDEYIGCASSGVGANGLCSIFTYLHKIRPDDDFLDKI
jgi:hypothetical protein